MINELLKRAFIISNNKMDINFKNAKTIPSGEFYLTVFNQEVNPAYVKDGCSIYYDNMKIDSIKQEVKYGALINGNSLAFSNGEMNPRNVYYIYEPKKELFIIFNNLILAREILLACDLDIVYSDNKIYDTGSYFKHIKLMNHSEVIEVNISKNKISYISRRKPDILTETNVDNSYTLEIAQNKFYGVLYKATDALTKGYQDVSVPLSGGIDSGSIAYLLSQLGKNVSAYSVATDWGDEYKEAKSTADYIGVNINKLYVSTDDICKEIPFIIAAFGFNIASNVEISLVPQCLFRKVNEVNGDKDVIYATGFGSDLLNAGIYKPFNTYEELRQDIISTLSKTRLSTETYTNLFFNNNSIFDSIKVVHPFWDIDVIIESLRIPPEFKVFDGKDKYFFRKMLENRIGERNCWRKKLAAHHGTGISFNLRNALSITGKPLTEDEYQNYFNEIHMQIFYKNDFSLLL